MKSLTNDRALLDLIGKYHESRESNSDWDSEKEQIHVFLLELYERRQCTLKLKSILDVTDMEISSMIDDFQDERGLLIT